MNTDSTYPSEKLAHKTAMDVDLENFIDTSDMRLSI